MPPAASSLQLPPPPRRLTAANDSPLFRFIGLENALFGAIAPALLIPLALALIAATVYLVLWFTFAQPLPAHITGGRITTGRPPYTLIAQYQAAGVTRTWRGDVHEAVYRQYILPAVPGKTPEGTPRPNATLTLWYFPGRANPERDWASLVFLVPFTLLSTAATLYALRKYWLLPSRARWLCRNGIAVPGTILDINQRPFVRSPNSIVHFSSWHVTWRYTTDPGEILTAKRWTNSGWLLDVAQSVTILYDPRRPTRSLIYEYCGYNVQARARVSQAPASRLHLLTPAPLPALPKPSPRPADNPIVSITSPLPRRPRAPARRRGTVLPRAL